MSSITIYHNPVCGTSRNVLALIRNSGEEPTVIEYLKTPPDRETSPLLQYHDISQPRLRHVAQRAGPDPQQRRGTHGHRIPEDTARPRNPATPDHGHGRAGARGIAREGHALRGTRPR